MLPSFPSTRIVSALTHQPHRRTICGQEGTGTMDAVQVVGAGGIGCAIGYSLRSAGVPVRFVEANPRKILAGLRHGVQIQGHPPTDAGFVTFDSWIPPAGATVLLCTKAFDNGAVLARLPAGVCLVPIQNGFDPLLERHEHQLEGIASFVSECHPHRPCTRITRAGCLHLGWRSITAAPRPPRMDGQAGRYTVLPPIRGAGDRTIQAHEADVQLRDLATVRHDRR